MKSSKAPSATTLDRRWRFRDLKAHNIVENRATLANWIRYGGFPPGQLTGPNTRTWGESEIQDFLDSRPTAPKPIRPARRPRGRPRRTETQSST
jgi:hypothetical protein